MKKPCAVNLDHVMTVSIARVGGYVTTLSDARLREVCRALGFALGCT